MSNYINSSFDDESPFRKFISRYKIHFLVWAIFICYETLLAGLVLGRFGSFINYSTHYSLNVLLFYLFAHKVLPLSLSASRKGVYVFLGILLVIGSYLVAVACLDSFLYNYTDSLRIDSLVFNASYWARNLWRCCYFVGFSTGYFYLSTYIQQKNRASELETEKLISIIDQQKTQAELIKVQNEFLRVRINPHFLFNTLTFLHGSTRNSMPRVAKTILLLSEIMRYSLKNEIKDENLLIEEVEHIKNFIELHKIRSECKLYFNIYSKGNFEEINFPPLILLTLTENIFKHGVLTDSQHPAEIYIAVLEEQLTIRTRNIRTHVPPPVSYNLGVKTIKKVLEQKYSENFIFEFGIDEGIYFTTLIEVNI
jgi:sensor histidine kinase YesM